MLDAFHRIESILKMLQGFLWNTKTYTQVICNVIFPSTKSFKSEYCDPFLFGLCLNCKRCYVQNENSRYIFVTEMDFTGRSIVISLEVAIKA